MRFAAESAILVGGVSGTNSDAGDAGDSKMVTALVRLRQSLTRPT